MAKYLFKVKNNSPDTGRKLNVFNMKKSVTDMNARLRNYGLQRGSGFFDNKIIDENHLEKKKLHLRLNTFFAKNLLRYINNLN